MEQKIRPGYAALLGGEAQKHVFALEGIGVRSMHFASSFSRPRHLLTVSLRGAEAGTPERPRHQHGGSCDEWSGVYAGSTSCSLQVFGRHLG